MYKHTKTQKQYLNTVALPNINLIINIIHVILRWVGSLLGK